MPNDPTTLMARYGVDLDQQEHGISRNLALGRILHFEALMRRRLGEVRPQRYVRLHNYYSGQNLPPDNVDQPLQINRFKGFVDKHTAYLWGQWEKNLVEWKVQYRYKDDLTPEQKPQVTATARKIKHFLEMTLDGAKFNRTLWQASKNGSLYGDAILEVRYEPARRQVMIEAVLPEYFHCMWDISNMQDLTEVIIAYPIDRMVALEQWGTSGNDQFVGYQAVNPHYLPGIGILWKRWSSTSFQVWVDDVCVMNGPNPYMQIDAYGFLYPGVIPYLHVPNMQAGSEFFGYSDGESALYLTDELNRRMADMGDTVSNHGHPTVLLSNYSGNQADLPTGPDAIWDLGQKGEASILESKGPAPEVMAYLSAVKTEMFETTAMPETAFGTQKGGTSHNTGLALSMAMMPVIERAKEKRLLWKERLVEMARLIFFLYQVRDPDLLKAAGLEYSEILLYDIEPIFASILPKDELQKVNENVATYSSGIRSLERVLESMGEEDVAEELDRIHRDMLFKASVAAAGSPSGGGAGGTPPAAGGSAGKNSEGGVGGSPDLPGGISASLLKGGTVIKDPSLPALDSLSMKNEP